MGRKGINRKEIEKIIIEKQNIGLTKQEIYLELENAYFDRKNLAIIIASTVDIHKKRKYRVINFILIILVSLSSLLKGMLLLSFSANLALVILSVVLAFLINFWFIYQIYKYRPFIYSFIGLLILLQEIKYLLAVEYISNWGIVELTFYLLVAVFSFIVKGKLFPKYGFFRPEKDKKGDVIFD